MSRCIYLSNAFCFDEEQEPHHIVAVYYSGVVWRENNPVKVGIEIYDDRLRLANLIAVLVDSIIDIFGAVIENNQRAIFILPCVFVL